MIENISRIEYCPRCDEKTLHHSVEVKRVSDWMWPVHIVLGMLTLGTYALLLAFYMYSERTVVKNSPWACRTCDNKLPRKELKPLIRSKTWK
jgi:hypothetical protein